MRFAGKCEISLILAFSKIFLPRTVLSVVTVHGWWVCIHVCVLDLHHIHTRVHTHCTHGTCGVLHCLLFCDQTRPNLRISLVGYHCAIEFPCGVPLFYCCKYPTTYGVRVHDDRLMYMYMHHTHARMHARKADRRYIQVRHDHGGRKQLPSFMLWPSYI